MINLMRVYIIDEPEPAYEPTPKEIAVADAWLMERGIAADADTLRKTAFRRWVTRVQLAETMMRRASGDWGQDDYSPAFPALLPTEVAPSRLVAAAPTAKIAEPGAVTFTELVAAWALESRPPHKSRDKWDTTFGGFAAIIGHDDARRVSVDDVRKWKQVRAAQERSPKTIADGIAVMRATFNWGSRNGLLPKDNPFSGMAPKVKKHGQSARDGYSDEQARSILLTARSETGWKRWLPWVLAFTGARIEEIAELRQRDIRQEAGGVWIVDIVPSATRPGKTAQSQRMVPVHPTLEAEGFLAYAAGLPADGPLWPDLPIGRYGSRGSTATKTHSRWVRAVVGITDSRVAPAHSWRHRMEDSLRIARVSSEAQDAITGHDNHRNAGAGYGRGFRGMPDELLKELRRIPSPLTPAPADDEKDVVTTDILGVPPPTATPVATPPDPATVPRSQLRGRRRRRLARPDNTITALLIAPVEPAQSRGRLNKLTGSVQ